MSTSASTLLNALKNGFVDEVMCPKGEWTIIVNFGPGLENEDGVFPQYYSRLVTDTVIKGQKLLAIPLSEPILEIEKDIVDSVRKEWTVVSDIFPDVEIFKGGDFYRSEKVRLEDYELNFWYCGPNYNCGIHNQHDFYEIHTQVLGIGEMQKFHQQDVSTLYERLILTPGQSHAPWCKTDQRGKPQYPWHCYFSQTQCIWLAIESPHRLVTQ